MLFLCQWLFCEGTDDTLRPNSTWVEVCLGAPEKLYLTHLKGPNTWHTLFLPSGLWLVLCENIKREPSTVISCPCWWGGWKSIPEDGKAERWKHSESLRVWWATKLTSTRPALPWDLLVDIFLYCLSQLSPLFCYLQYFLTDSSLSYCLFISFRKLVEIPSFIPLCTYLLPEYDTLPSFHNVNSMRAGAFSVFFITYLQCPVWYKRPPINMCQMNKERVVFLWLLALVTILPIMALILEVESTSVWILITDCTVPQLGIAQAMV